MKLSPFAVLVAAALSLGLLFTAGCGGGGSVKGPTAIWNIYNNSGAFSGVTGARFGYGTRNSSGNNVIANHTVLNQDSSTVSLRHSLPRSIDPLPGEDFDIYLPVVWRDSDGDRWPDGGETQYFWRDATYTYALIYGTTDYAYPGWSKWRLWFSGGTLYKQFVSSIESEVTGSIYTGFYSSRGLDQIESGKVITPEDIIRAEEVAPEE